MNLKELQLIVKEPSHKKVLNLIRREKKISGAQIARITGMQPSSIHYILKYLSNMGLVSIDSTGESTNSGGKPPLIWKIKNDMGYLIGIEILASNTRWILTDLSGENIIEKESADIIYSPEKESFSFFCTSVIQSIIKTNKLNTENILGCTIAVTGITDNTFSEVIYSRHLKLEHYSLKNEVEASAGIPVFVINDANAGAIGCSWFNNNSVEGWHNIVYTTLNSEANELGIGLYIQGQLYSGKMGLAGELIDALPSTTQLYGENVSRFPYSPLSEIFSSNDVITMNDLIACNKQQCPLASHIISLTGNYIASEILRISALLAPDHIFIGGNIPDMSLLLNEYIYPVVKERYIKTFVVPEGLPSISVSPLGYYSVAYGAIALLLMNIFNE